MKKHTLLLFMLLPFFAPANAQYSACTKDITVIGNYINPQTYQAEKILSGSVNGGYGVPTQTKTDPQNITQFLASKNILVNDNFIAKANAKNYFLAQAIPCKPQDHIPDPNNYLTSTNANGDVILTEETLKNYLKRSIDIVNLTEKASLQALAQLSSGNDAHDPFFPSLSNPVEIDNWMEFIDRTHPKFLPHLAGWTSVWWDNYGQFSGPVGGMQNNNSCSSYTGTNYVDWFAICKQLVDAIHVKDDQIICGADLAEIISSVHYWAVCMNIPSYVADDLWGGSGSTQPSFVNEPVKYELWQYFNNQPTNNLLHNYYDHSQNTNTSSNPNNYVNYLSHLNATYDLTSTFCPWAMQAYSDQMQPSNNPLSTPYLEIQTDNTGDLNIDICQPQTIAWLYYIGTKYIDAGFESLIVGEFDNMVGKNDIQGNYEIPYNGSIMMYNSAPISAPKNSHIDYLCKKLREYSRKAGSWQNGKKSRRGFVLMAGDGYGQWSDNNHDLVFDYQGKKLCLKETNGQIGTNQIWGNGQNNNTATPGLIAYGDGLITSPQSLSITTPNINVPFDGTGVSYTDPTTQNNITLQQSVIPCFNCDYEATIGCPGQNPDDPYHKMISGINPAGWTCNTGQNPYIVWFDNVQGMVRGDYDPNGTLTGNTAAWISPIGCNPLSTNFTCAPPLYNGTCSFPWTWDESTWYGTESKEYRDQFLVYAWNKIRCISNQSGYISMPGIKPVSPYFNPVTNGGNSYQPFHMDYRAYRNNNLPYPNNNLGFGQEETIKSIWDANDFSPSSTPPTNINGEDIRSYNKWANDFYLSFITALPTDMKFYLGDFNGDNETDILATADPNGSNHWQGIKIFLNQGSGVFNFNTPDYQGGWEGWGEHFYIGDFNGDGKDDFIVTANLNTNIYWQGYNIFTSSINAQNTLSFTQTFGANFPSCGEQFYIGDFNGDGYDDFVVTSDPLVNTSYNWFGNKLFINDANGQPNAPSFTMPAGYYMPYPSEGERFYIGDFNNDGKDDILVTADKARISNQWLWTGYNVFHSNGSGFDHKAYGVWPSWGENLAIGDWNHDGCSDFTCVASYQNGVNWQGSKTYLCNNIGNHFIYAFDDDPVGNTVTNNSGELFSYKNKLYSFSTQQQGQLNVPVLIEYQTYHCSSTITNSAKPGRNNNKTPKYSDLNHNVPNTSISGTNNGVIGSDNQFSGFKVVPNPTTSFANFIPIGNIIYPVILNVKDVSGRILNTQQYSSDIRVDLSPYSPGLYIIDIQTSSGIFTYKVTKY